MSSTSHSIGSQTWKDNVLLSVQCPIDLEHLTEAVTCIPCAHKVNEEAAKILFGVDPGQRVESPCPICRGNVETYQVDHTMRTLVGLLLGKEAGEVADQLPKTCAKIAREHKETKDIPFPGKGAKFVRTSGKFEPPYLLRFYSKTPGSLFKSFKIKKMMNLQDSFYSFVLKVSFSQKNAEKIFEFLSEKGLDIQNRTSRKRYAASGNNAKKLFGILAKHNEIHKISFKKIRKIMSIEAL